MNLIDFLESEKNSFMKGKHLFLKNEVDEKEFVLEWCEGDKSESLIDKLGLAPTKKYFISGRRIFSLNDISFPEEIRSYAEKKKYQILEKEDLKKEVESSMQGIFHEGCFTKAEALRAREDKISLDDLKLFFKRVMHVNPGEFRDVNSPFWDAATEESTSSFLISLQEEDLLEIFYLEEYALIQILQDWWKRTIRKRKRERKAFFLKQAFRRKVEKKEGIFHIRNIEDLQNTLFYMKESLDSENFKSSSRISIFFKGEMEEPLILRGTGIFDTEIILSLYQDLYLKGEDFSLFSIFEDAGSEKVYTVEEKDLDVLKKKHLTDIFRMEVVKERTENFLPDFSMLDLSKLEKKIRAVRLFFW